MIALTLAVLLQATAPTTQPATPPATPPVVPPATVPTTEPTTQPATEPAAEPVTRSVPVPALFVGTFAGTVDLAGPEGVQRTVPMKLEVQPASNGVTWTITYGEGDTAQVRPYVLIGTDVPGRLLIDERDGLLIDHTLIGNTLIGGFSVQDAFISTHYHFTEEGVEIELVTYTAPNRDSQTLDGSFMISSPTVAGMQHGMLARQK